VARISVLDPDTDEPITLEVDERPTATVIRPDGTEDELEVVPEGDHFRVSIVGEKEGAHKLIVETPAPHQEVAEATRYCNPR